MSTPIDRRHFLIASLAACLLPWAVGARAALPTPAAAGLCDCRLLLHHTHTGEQLDVCFRDATGALDPIALAQLDHLLRCHYTNEIHPIDVATLDHLWLVNRQLGCNQPLEIVSGYRSRDYNDKLRQQGRGVVEQSLHLSGRAVDVRFPGVALAQVRQTALDLRRGGVGYYPRSGFVHLDSGPVRAW